MPKPLSNDIRERLVDAVVGGMSRNAAAKHFRVSVSAVVRLMQRWQTTGDFKPKPMHVFHGYKLTEHQAVVEKLIASESDLTLKEIQKRLLAKSIVVSSMGVSRFLDHLGISYKKNGTRQRTKPARRQSGAGRMEEKPREA
jgi:putative transposase